MRALLWLPATAMLTAAAPAFAQDPHAGHKMPEADPQGGVQAPVAPADPHAGHQAPVADPHAGHTMPLDDLGDDIPIRAGPDRRRASGTAWQPAVTPHGGVHTFAGPWMIMTHATLNGIYDSQSGPRGDEKTFVSGMFMTTAERSVGYGQSLTLRAMLSPDPLMGRRGYPLLLASGETGDGTTPLVDRQHPHDFFMELSARYDRSIGGGRAFLYAGLPGEPAFGPPAFMHRLSIMDSPEAPISHHWLDSTHIVFGVVTAGYAWKDVQVEVSRFKGREPDEHRWDIETPKLDSTAARLTWNPSPNLSLQGSWAKAKDVEQLEPDEDQTKWSASAIYTRRLGADGWWSTTAAWGRRSAGHHNLDAFVLESAVKPNAAWTVFARAERTENNELSGGAHHGPTYDVGKVSVGAVRDWKVAEHVSLGLGGLYAKNWVPAGLEASYGGDQNGGMAFVRLKIE